MVRLVVCVCVCFRIDVLIFFIVERCFWRFQNDVWILGYVACLIAFISVFFPSWKTIFKQFQHLLDTSQYLAYLSRFSIVFFIAISTPLDSLVDRLRNLLSPRYLLDPLSLLCCGHLDTSWQMHLSKLLKLDTCLDTSAPLFVEIYWGSL